MTEENAETDAILTTSKDNSTYKKDKLLTKSVENRKDSTFEDKKCENNTMNNELNSSSYSNNTEQQTNKKENNFELLRQISGNVQSFQMLNSGDIEPEKDLNKKRKRNTKSNKDNNSRNEYKIQKQLILQKKIETEKRIKKMYPEEKYTEELNEKLKNNRHSFMKDNFPSMYGHINFYSFVAYPEIRRKLCPQIFINKEESEQQRKENFFLYDNTQNSINLPKKVWSVPKDKDEEDFESDIEDFKDRCKEEWPNDKCFFVWEHAMEFFMLKNYDSKECFDNLDEFVEFMKDRNTHTNYPIIDKSATIIKGHNLRIRKPIQETKEKKKPKSKKK
ncbi:MAG: hypothetical protein MJ252_09465 [archaeon]|nr:hypothetical protein [archaeon]